MIETQASIDKWATSIFGRGTPRAIAMRLQVEMNELLSALDVDEHAETEATRDEAADVAILLLRLAAVSGFSFWAAVDRKMGVNRQRKWVSNGDGTGQHVRGEEKR